MVYFASAVHCKKLVVVLTIGGHGYLSCNIPIFETIYSLPRGRISIRNDVSISSDNDAPCDNTLSHRGNHNN